MIVIGIDPSTTSIGWAVYDHRTRRLLGSGTLRCGGRDAFDRTERLKEALRIALGPHVAAQYVLIERMFSTKGAADRALANAAYAIRQVLTEFGMRVREISVGTWRKRLLGKGNATKQQVQTYVELLHQRKFPSLDEAEAIAIAMSAERADFEEVGR